MSRKRVATTERVVCAWVTRRHGAWLVAWTGPLTGDQNDHELYDCAGSHDVAKRVAREGAAELGYLPAWRWRQDSPGLWQLTAKYAPPRTRNPDNSPEATSPKGEA